MSDECAMASWYLLVDNFDYMVRQFRTSSIEGLQLQLRQELQSLSCVARVWRGAYQGPLPDQHRHLRSLMSDLL